MSNHLILPLETLSAFTPGASFYTTVVWSVGRVDVRMRVQEVLFLH